MNKIVVLIDESGSMYSLKQDAIGGFNSFLEQQQKLGDDATMTVVLFNIGSRVHAQDQILSKVQPLTDSTYIPNGGTALLDALGNAISGTLARRSDDKVLVCVITDGEENSSTEFKKSDVEKLIKDKTDNGWEFLFLSSDLNAISDARDYGFKNVVTFSANAKGTMDAYNSVGTSTMLFRGYDVKEDN